MNINHKKCPICGSSNQNTVILSRDYSVSKEEFPVNQCFDCDFLFTQNAPDEEHIGKYYKSENYVSHNDTKKGLFFKVYHWIRNIMLKRKSKLIERYTQKKQGNILDVGSATGYFLNEMKTKGWSVEGIEQDEDAANIGLNKFNISARRPESIKEIESKSKDAISLWHVLEHIHDLNSTIQEFKRILKDDGILMVAVPNHTSYDASFYKKHWAAWDLPIHLWHFKPQNMSDLMAKHQMEIIKKHAMPFDSIYIALLSEQYKRGSAIRGLFIGGLAMILGLLRVNKSSSIIYVIKKQTNA